MVCKCQSKNIPISGPNTQTKARQIAEQMPITEFKALNGWLESLKIDIKLFGIKFEVSQTVSMLKMLMNGR